jgi:hypothetical protein
MRRFPASVFDFLLGRGKPEPSIQEVKAEARPPTVAIANQERGASTIPSQQVYVTKASDFDEVIEGWEFNATLQLRTPLIALEHHGEVIRGVRPDGPTYGPPWAGIWLPKEKSWAELGLPFRESPPGDMASEIGPVPEDGGTFLPFLKDYRRIIEGSGSIDERIAAVRAVLAREEYSSIVEQLGPGFEDSWAVEDLALALGVTGGIAEKLFDAGLRDTASVRAATDATLRRIKGIGPAALNRIRGRAST